MRLSLRSRVDAACAAGFADNTYLSLPKDGLPYTTLMYSTGPGAEESAPRRDLTDVDIHDTAFKQQALVKMSQETHGGEDVPVHAVGPMAHLFHGVHEQHYIAHVMAHAACIGHNKKHCRGRAHAHAAQNAEAVAGDAQQLTMAFSTVFFVSLSITSFLFQSIQ